MKVLLKVSDLLTIEAEGETPKDLFNELSMLQEIFQHEKCELCESDKIKFVSRTVDKYEYHELRCSNCGGRLSFGHQEGGKLFPKRTWNSLGDENKSKERINRAHQKEYADANRGWLPNGGWYKWKDTVSK